MSGLAENARTRARLDREDRLAQYIEERRPVGAVAALELIDHDYAYKLLRQVATKRNLEYTPRRVVRTSETPIPGLTEASHNLRARLGDALHELQAQRPDAGRAAGLPVKSVLFARDRPFNHDWTLSQIERLALASNINFTEMLLRMLMPRKQDEAA